MVYTKPLARYFVLFNSEERNNLCSICDNKSKLKAVLDNSYDLKAETTAATPDVETGYEKIPMSTS